MIMIEAHHAAIFAIISVFVGFALGFCFCAACVECGKESTEDDSSND